MSKAKPTLSRVASTLVPKKLGHRSLPKKHGLRKVVVLGAGASKSFGLPLATELLPDMIGWHRARGGDSGLKDIFEFRESARGGQTGAARVAEGRPAALAE